MEEEFLQFLLNAGAANIGPDAREILAYQAETEYNNGNKLNSVFYQVSSLYQTSQERFHHNSGENSRSLSPVNIDETDEDFKNNPLLQYCAKFLREKSANKQDEAGAKFIIGSNFLKNITDSTEGISKISQICLEMPKEWTILQLFKGPRTETTYTIFPKIHESDAPIYLTLLKHARSKEYANPICLRISGSGQQELFKKFASIVNRFKQCISNTEWNAKEAKLVYWKILDELNSSIALSCADLRNFFYPWSFLFSGIPQHNANTDKCWSKIDVLCNTYNLDDESRVILSLAALHIHDLSKAEIEAICLILIDDNPVRAVIKNLLHSMQNGMLKSDSRRYPCIMVIDERLDHFYWEEMNATQEFCRVNTLQRLWHLHQHYKSNIKKGYLNVNITEGSCLLNPDKNLPKMEQRMQSFFKYWTPHWDMMVGQRPTHDQLFSKYLKQPCYVYAGHGSGLQYINGRNIAKQEIKSVVFLFGCDSSRLLSNGLYSELFGSHLYYHAAMCPTLVGTLMPGLDSNMDRVATDILSRWIAPNSTSVMPWNMIDVINWIKKGTIEAIRTGSEQQPPTMEKYPKYNIGSLCAILAKVHQRVGENKLYNTVPYVCRGLPAWNTNVQPLP